MNENRILKCRKCGTETDSGSRFCNSCGARIYDIEKILAPGTFSLKLTLVSSLLTLIFVLLSSIIISLLYSMIDPELINNPEKLQYITLISSELGIFSSALFNSYVFINTRIKESFSGALIFIAADFLLASAFTIEGIGVVLLSCFTAFTGAWLGFSAKKNIKFKN